MTKADLNDPDVRLAIDEAVEREREEAELSSLPWMGFVALLCLLTSCAHVAMTRVDYQENSFTLCGNKWADRSDFAEVAARSCQGSPTAAELLRCGLQQTGAVAVNYGYGVVGAHATYSTCCDYRCR